MQRHTVCCVNHFSPIKILEFSSQSNRKSKLKYRFIVDVYFFLQFFCCLAAVVTTIIVYHDRDLFNFLCFQVVQVVAPSDGAAENESSQTIEQLSQCMFRTICAKVRDLASRNPNRKVVLVGWHTTSVVNCQVSQIWKLAE